MLETYNYKEYSRVEFDKAYQGTTFLRFNCSDSEKYNSDDELRLKSLSESSKYDPDLCFKFRLGLNHDIVPFSPLKGTGYYFYEESKCYLYCPTCDDKIALIEIPDGAKVYIENEELQLEELYILIVKQNGLNLQYVTNLACLGLESGDVYRFAVQQNGMALQYVRNDIEDALLYELQKRAVLQNGLALQYVTPLSRFSLDVVCELAVQQNGMALQFVKVQTYDICKLAVQQTHLAFRYVNEEFRTECPLDRITFIEKAREKHGDKYDYSDVIYEQS